MLKRPERKNLTIDEQNSIINASRSQTGKTQVIKSYDPAYPVFEVPVNQKLLVYIPNHIITLPDGSVDMRADKFAAHPYQAGREFGNIRCSNGVVIDSLGLDGTCPACDAVTESWELYNYEWEELAKSRGFADGGEAAKTALKEDMKKLLEARTMKAPDIWYTFPIVVIDCEVGADGKPTTTPKLDANGQITGKPCWYSIREKSYIDKWLSSLDALTINGSTPTHPAGLWAVLNFTYQSSDGTHDKMQSAKNLKVAYKSPDASLMETNSRLDKLTEDWTPQLASDCVVLDVIRSMEEMHEAVDTIMKSTREKIAMYKTVKGVGATPQLGASNAQEALASFGATPVEGAVPAVGLPNGATPITSEMPNTVGVQ